MIWLPPDVRERIEPHLEPSEEIAAFQESTFDREGGYGRTCVVLTSKRLHLFFESFGQGEPELVSVDRRELSAIEIVPLEGFRMAAVFLSGRTERGRILFDPIDRPRFEQIQAAFAAGTAAGPPPREMFLEESEYQAASPILEEDPPDEAVPVEEPPAAPPPPPAEETVLEVELDEIVPVPGQTPRRRGIELELDRDQVSSGEALTGRLLLEWPRAGKVRGVRIAFEGGEDTRISVTTGSGKNRHTRTYREHAPIVRDRRVLFGKPEAGFFENVSSGLAALFGGGDFPALAAGVYEYRFRFPVPAHALPNYKGHHASVSYRLHAYADIPAGFDLSDGTQVAVLGRFNAPRAASARYPGDSRGLLDGLRPEVALAVEVEPTVDRISGTASIRNTSGKRIDRLDLDLRAFEHASARGHSRTTTVQSVRFQIPLGGATEIPFDLEVPPEFPLPYRGSYSRVWWQLAASLDIAWALDVGVVIDL